jgi:hypothetical protein
MSEKLKQLLQHLLVGVWEPMSGNPAETLEFRADGTVCLLMLGGLLPLHGRYQHTDDIVLEIEWEVTPSAEAEDVVAALNASLAETPAAPQVSIKRRTKLNFAVTPTELHTHEVEKQRYGHFRRVASSSV